MNLDKVTKIISGEDSPGDLWFIETIQDLIEEVTNLRKHLTDSHACFDPIVSDDDEEEEEDPTYGENSG